MNNTGRLVEHFYELREEHNKLVKECSDNLSDYEELVKEKDLLRKQVMMHEALEKLGKIS